MVDEVRSTKWRQLYSGSTTIAVMESRAHKLGTGIAPRVALTTATRFNTCKHCKVDWDDASQSSLQYPEEGHPALQGETKQGHTKMKQIPELITSHQTTKEAYEISAMGSEDAEGSETDMDSRHAAKKKRGAE